LDFFPAPPILQSFLGCSGCARPSPFSWLGKNRPKRSKTQVCHPGSGAHFAEGTPRAESVPVRRLLALFESPGSMEAGNNLPSFFWFVAPRILVGAAPWERTPDTFQRPNARRETTQQTKTLSRGEEWHHPKPAGGHQSNTRFFPACPSFQ